MAIYNLGSINIDYFYQVPRLVLPGETIAASAFHFGLGGKGANQSIAAARGGASVFHIGAVGPDGEWALERLDNFGVNTDNVASLEIPTGHAIITVDPEGENAIVIYSSANVALAEEQIEEALSSANEGDFCILQNETNLAPFTAQMAKERGMRVVYSAAPFDENHVREMLPHIDILVVNEVEATQLAEALETNPDELPISQVLITRGSGGAVFRSSEGEVEVPAFDVVPIDTTGAGDTYLGFFVAGLDAGMDTKGAMTFASAGAAIQVMRSGTGDAIPELLEVKAFLEERLAG